MLLVDQIKRGTVAKCCTIFVRDFGFILFASLPLIGFSLWVANEPLSGGFYCDDHSLMYPLKVQTITTTAYILFCIVLVPVTCFTVCEFISFRYQLKQEESQPTFRKYLTIVYEYLIDFSYGFWIQLGLYILPKFLTVELRPHFFAACMPIMDGNTTCMDSINYGRYITDYHCSNPNSNVVLNAHLSFPSGHSSGSFYAAAYLCGYVQSKLVMHRYVRLSVQYSLTLMAVFVAISRVADHYHHWIDVIVGFFMGIGLGLWMIYMKLTQDQMNSNQ